MVQQQHISIARLALATTLAALTLAGCGAAERNTGVVDDWGDMPPKQQDELLMAVSDQKQMGYQIEAMTSGDDARTMCTEICRRVARSCQHAKDVCAMSVKYPDVTYAGAQCTVSRDRCKAHGSKVPRECACDLQDE